MREMRRIDPQAARPGFRCGVRLKKARRCLLVVSGQEPRAGHAVHAVEEPEVLPALALDAIEGGAKVTKQARALDWSQHFAIESVTPETLENSLEYCLTEAAREEARSCAARSVAHLRRLREEFIRELMGEETTLES